MDGASTTQPQRTDRYRLGGNIVHTPTCFSDDEKTFFCCSGSVVKTFNVATGALLGVLEGHTRRVTSVMINPNNNLQVFTTSHDGTIRQWDYIESQCLQEFDVELPVLRAVISKHHIYYVADPEHYSRFLNDMKNGRVSVKNVDVNRRSTNSQTCRLLSLNITAKATTPNLIKSDMYARALAISANQEYLATVSESTLTIFHLSTGQVVQFDHQSKLTTVCFHPSEAMIATGDDAGRVVLWVNYRPSFAALAAANGSADVIIPTPAKTLFHWHAHPVTALAFSEDGSYILSGAAEGTLVFWQVGTGHKTFVPRLGDALLHISTSPRGNLYAVACADNAIRMVNALNNKVLHSIQGLQYATCFSHYSSGAMPLDDADFNRRIAEKLTKRVQHTKKQNTIITSADFTLDVSSNDNMDLDAQLEEQVYQENNVTNKSLLHMTTGLIPHPHPGHIVVPGKMGHLQVYDAVADQHVGSVAVVDRNYLAPNPNNRDSEPVIRVEHVTFSSNGDWMATVDRFSNGKTTERESLKFWMRNGAYEAAPAAAPISTGSNIFNNKPVKVPDSKSGASSSNTGFTLNTRSENAHSNRITSIVFHPTQNLVVTAATDYTFRLWSLIKKEAPSTTGLKPGEAASTTYTYMWACTGTGKYRDTPVTSCAFSSDGSVLAVSYGQVVTLWKATTEELTLKTTLVHPPPFSPIRWLRFVKNTPYLIAVTHTSLYVWNILTCTVAWSYHLQTAAIATHPTLPYFAALVVLPSVSLQKKKRKAEDIAEGETPKPAKANAAPLHKPAKRCALLLFNVESATPIRVVDASDARFEKSKTSRRQYLRDEQGRPVHTNDYNLFTSTSIYTSALTFMPSCSDALESGISLPIRSPSGLPLDTASILYLNRSKELIRVPNVLHCHEADHATASALLAHAHDAERKAAMQASMKVVPSVFSLIYSNSSNAQMQAKPAATQPSADEVKHVQHLNTLHTALQSFLKTPAHVMGSLAMVYNSYMDAFLRKRQRTK